MNILEKKYYSLIELCTIVKLKYRQLQKRVKIVNKKYSNKKELIFKKSNRWFIHNSIIKDFLPIRKPIDYKLFVTIASKNKLELKYWRIVVYHLYRSLKKSDNTTRMKYVVEQTKNGNYHLHFITSYDNLKRIRKIIIENDITNSSNDMNTKIKYITDIKNLTQYLSKENKPILLK